VVSSFILFLGVALFIDRFRKVSSTITKEEFQPSTTKDVNANLSAIGKFMFDTSSRRLLSGNQIIELTDKESKILELLNRYFGQLTTREDLMKIWTDEGVITGRSLDMFVSKLRKKISSDPELRITNVHGKGYKLEVVKELL
jgi:DNA-binding response OmpR family regulator